MKTYQVNLTGQTALLMHSDSIEGADMIGEWRKNRKDTPKGDDRYPSWTWKTYLYWNEQETSVVIPAPNIMACLRKAGAQKTLVKTTTYKVYTQTEILVADSFELLSAKTGKPILKSQIDAIDNKDSFKGSRDAVKKLGFDIDMRRAKIGSKKHIRTRPYFAMGWKASGIIYVTDPEIFPLDVLQDIFDIAGSLVGLCDYRPGAATPGMFGKFKAELKAIK